MKKILAFILLMSLGVQALACDAVIAKFSRDCAIQDRLAKVRGALAAKNIDINEVAEYRVLRFIDRGSWETAKTNHTAPIAIYNPAPATWTVWDEGIRSIFKEPNYKGILFRALHIDDNVISNINRVLLTDGMSNIKDPHTDQKKNPGDFRLAADLAVGYCNPGVTDMSPVITKSKQSVERFQQRWEQITGLNFQDVVRRRNGLAPEQATMEANMYQDNRYSCGATNSWISFAPSADVEKQVNWLEVFVNTNLDLYMQGHPAVAPIELAAFTQKWLVTIHPFSDGNGRTSRGLQDMLLANFGMPFAPGGDLQNDAMAEFEPYLNATYSRMESMLTTLEYCANTEGRPNPAPQRKFICSTVAQLNAGTPMLRLQQP